MKRPSRKLVITLAIAAAVIILLVAMVAARKREKPIPVTTDKAFRKNVTQLVTGNGLSAAVSKLCYGVAWILMNRVSGAAETSKCRFTIPSTPGISSTTVRQLEVLRSSLATNW